MELINWVGVFLTIINIYLMAGEIRSGNVNSISAFIYSVSLTYGVYLLNY